MFMLHADNMLTSELCKRRYFYVAFGGYYSEPVSVDATADDIQVALAALPSVGKVLVTRSEIIESYGYAWTVTFLNSEWWQGDKYFSVPPMLLSSFDGTYVSEYTTSVNSNQTSMTGRTNTFQGTDAQIKVTTLVHAMSGYEQQSVQVEASSGSLMGTFTLFFNGSTTPALPVNASDADLEAAIELLPGK